MAPNRTQSNRALKLGDKTKVRAVLDEGFLGQGLIQSLTITAPFDNFYARKTSLLTLNVGRRRTGLLCRRDMRKSLRSACYTQCK
jgi:hypothetical protein